MSTLRSRRFDALFVTSIVLVLASTASRGVVRALLVGATAGVVVAMIVVHVAQRRRADGDEN